MFEDQDSSRDVRVLKPEQVKFDKNNHTLLLVVDNSLLGSDHLSDTAEVRGLQSKSEFHVTVIGFRAGKIIEKALKVLNEPDRKAKETEIEQLSQETDWEFSTDSQSLFHIQKDYSDSKQSKSKETRESIIQTVNMPGLAVFYRRLNEILGVNLEAPPAHITLYTGGTNPATSKMGIGIDTPAALNELHPERLET